jgi:two-component system chemotaxis response regulator CheY
MAQRTVLVVDDHAAMRELLKLHLTNAGYEVVVAEDALVAGRQLMKSPPDLLLIDVNMPYMNGVEFVATLLADGTVPCVPVVFITGAPVTLQAEALGAEVLRKPFVVKQLLEVVDRRMRAIPAAIPEADRPHA